MRSAIVTGAGSGINLEFSRLLLQRGHNVLFADIALRPEAEELIGAYQLTPNKAAFQNTDVTSWVDLDKMFATAEHLFGSVDIVCPGAGVFEPHWSNFWHPPGTRESTDDPIGGGYKLFDINLIHPIRVTQLAISRFLASSPPPSPSNPEFVVHIASVAAQIATLMFPMYCASKHAVQAFVRCLAQLDDTHGIRVTAVDPGIVKTPIWTEHPEKNKVLHQKASDDDEWVTPQEVAEVMLACIEKSTIETGVPGEPHIAIKGGSCLEVLAGTVRDVPLYNNPGPFALGRKGAEASHPEQLIDEVLGLLTPGWGTKTF